MKNVIRLAIAMLLSLAMFLPNSVSAESEIIEADGDYVMDSRLDETAASATARAREEAKRNAVERAGVFVQAYSKTKNLVLEEDEVKTITAHLLKILDEKNSVEVLQDNLLKFTVHIWAEVDASDPQQLQALMSNRNLIDEMTARNNELQRQYDALKRQMEELKTQYDSASDSRKAELKRAAAQNDERFKAMQELEKVYALNNRANAYAALGQYQNALDTLLAALEMKSDMPELHNNLGSVYVSLNRLDDGLREYNEALRLNPNYADALFNRGCIFYRRGKYSDALKDAEKAARFKPDDVAIRQLKEHVKAKLNG